MVIRSNGNLSLTSSGDLFIGLNDKTETNAGDVATRGTGTVCIDGGTLLLNADNYLKATSGSIGLYGFSGGTGSGILVTPTSATVNSQGFYMNTGYVYVGSLGGQTKVTVGNTE